MDFTDEGILIGARPLGEANAIVELFTQHHGRHLGLVRGGRSRRLRPLLQPGNVLSVTWRARLSEHLGSFTVELVDARAALLLDNEAALAAIGSLTTLAKLLPERDPHPQLYAEALHVLRTLDDPQVWPALLVHWELLLLQDLGFGLDLSACAATGVAADLSYVSPRSGRAVSRDAGKPYCDRLLKLPRFLLEEGAPASPHDIAAGFALTRHFLERDVLSPQGLTMPQPRERLMALLARAPRALEPAQPMR
jgi:DNA repair protein RecO (recombination protein O)